MTIDNLIIIGKNVKNVDLIKNSINENTEIFLVDSTTTEEYLLNHIKGKTYTSVGYFAHYQAPETHSITPDVTYNLENDKDALVNFWNKFETQTVDYLGCSTLKNEVWKNTITYLEEKTSKQFRASDDNTGNLEAGGDWVLESDGVNVKDLYFTEEINVWMGLLDPIQDVYNYIYTGAVQTFRVPDGTTSISVDAYGASGTTGVTFSQTGKGGRVQANLTVTPGATLNIYVGGARQYFGAPMSSGGWNGGGNGPGDYYGGVGFPGGGATDIRIDGTDLSNRVIVAGGGGGPANVSGAGGAGGDGGGLVGQSGTNRGGGGGSETKGGERASGDSDYLGGSGVLGQGGAGNANSGGGGGGYYGGGGGSFNSGGGRSGGGGSSYTDLTLSSSVIHTQGVQTGSGKLTITVTQGDGPDVIRPVITVTTGTDTVLQGSTWTDAGATADTGETVIVVSNTVDTSAAGVYTVTYSATDATGNVGTATRIVTVNLDTLKADGTQVQWAHTTGNYDGIQYDLVPPQELRAPSGYTVVLKNASENIEYNTGLEFVFDVDTLLVPTGNMNGRGYGGLYYMSSNGGNWDHWKSSYVAFARPRPDTTAPTIMSGAVGINLTENSGSGQTVYTIYASDAIGVVSYTIGGTDAAFLTLTGNVVSLIADPDYEAKISYSFTVSASDAAGNTSAPTTVTFSINNIEDEIAPVITVISGTDTVEKGSTWTDAGATTDTGELAIASGAVDTSVCGTYTITYTATDASGNTGTATRTVTVVDTTAPVITVAAGTDTVEHGSSWVDAGATADTGETVTVSGTVNGNALGTYTITYTATDAALNTGTATRTVTVVDTTNPVITLSGDATVIVEVGSTYTDEGATALDNHDGNITSSITAISTVDTSTVGTYKVTYNVTDANNNAAVEVVRTVNVLFTINNVFITKTSTDISDLKSSNSSLNREITAIIKTMYK
mgnify:CR=1 FL=1